jgi:hypothetical protein
LSRKDVSGILLALLALSMSMLVFNVAVKQARADNPPDPWEMPTVYLQAIDLGPNKLRVNCAVYNLTNAFYPTDEEWDPGEPLGLWVNATTQPVSRYNYSLGNLYAFEFIISWDPTVLGYLSHDKTVPRSTYQPFRSKGILNSPVLQGVDDVDPVAGTYRIAYSSQFPALSFNAPEDAANVFSMTFTKLTTGPTGLNLDSVSLIVDNIRFPNAQPLCPWRAVMDPDPGADHNVGVEAAPRNKDVVGETKAFDTYALVRNTGSTPETFNVYVYAGSTQVGTASTTVAAGTAQTVKITCSTAGLAKGTYIIKANATVPGDVYDADNELIQGSIIVTLPGDVDGNKAVNIFDIVKMAGAYGASSQEHTKYDPYSDLNNDGKVDIFDIVTAAGNYGKSWT